MLQRAISREQSLNEAKDDVPTVSTLFVNDGIQPVLATPEPPEENTMMAVLGSANL